jgi:ribosomal protein L7/L12
MEIALAVVVALVPLGILVALVMRGKAAAGPRARDQVAPREGHAHLEPIHGGGPAPIGPVSPLPTGPLDAAQDAEVRRWVAAGEKIQAIKRWRELTGLGLAESKAAVDALFAQGLPALLQSVPQGHGSLPPPTSRGQPSPELVLEARQLVATGKKIEAIKRWREATGLGLKEAKDAVEAL